MHGILNLALCWAYILLFVVIPGGVIVGRWRSLNKEGSPGLSAAVVTGLMTNIVFSALFRAAEPWHSLPIGGFFALYAAPPAIYLVKTIRQSRGRAEFRACLGAWFAKVTTRENFFKFFVPAAAVGVFICVIAAKFSYPFHMYYADDHQRLSIAHFIKLAYPPPEFHVFSNSTYRYYNFAELLTANISEFTSLSNEWVYFRFLLPFNWLLLLLGVTTLTSLAGASFGFGALAFVFLTVMQGPGGGVKLSHFFFHQDTLALAFVVFGLGLLLRAYKARSGACLLLATLAGSMTIGIKPISIVCIAIPIALGALQAVVTRRIGIIKVLASALVGAAMCLGVYFGIVHNAVAGASPRLIWNPSNYWIKKAVTDVQACDAGHTTFWIFDFFGDVLKAGDPLWRNLALSAVYCFEAVILLIVAIAFMRPKDRIEAARCWFLPAGAMLSIGIFACYEFTISDSSITYFMNFGTWTALVAALYCLAVAYRQETKKALTAAIAVLLVTGFSSYGYKAWRPPGLQHHYIHSPAELQAMAYIRTNSPPDAYVLHDYYKLPRIWSFASLAARKAVVTSLFDGAINQDKALYLKIIGEADRFYENKYSAAETISFLDRYRVEMIFWDTDIHPSPPREIPGFKVGFAAGDAIVWERAHQ